MTLPPSIGSVPPPAPLRVDAAALRTLSGAERAFGFAIEGTPPGAGRSRAARCGTLCLCFVVEGRISSASEHGLALETTAGVVSMRYALPRGVAFGALVGEHVRVSARQVLSEPTSFELRVERAGGRLALFAFDGDPSTIEDGVVLTWDAEAHTLCLAIEGQPPVALPRQLGGVALGDQSYLCVCLCSSPRRAAFVLLG